MTEFRAHAPPLPPIPDDLTCAQFILDRTHTRRPLRPAHAPWFVDAATGRPVFLEEVRLCEGVRVRGADGRADTRARVGVGECAGDGLWGGER
jgi:hypothetical protein